jgi:hypothetical protein
MIAASLLDGLTRLGFRVSACDGGIAVTPARKLTAAMCQAILDNKEGLLALLCPAKPPSTPVTTPEVETPQPQLESVPRPIAKPEAKTPPPRHETTPRPGPVPVPEAPKPVLCPRCRQKGYPDCVKCLLASDPGLELGPDGVLYRTSYLGTPFQNGPIPRRDWPRKLG